MYRLTSVSIVYQIIHFNCMDSPLLHPIYIVVKDMLSCQWDRFHSISIPGLAGETHYRRRIWLIHWQLLTRVFLFLSQQLNLAIYPGSSNSCANIILIVYYSTFEDFGLRNANRLLRKSKKKKESKLSDRHYVIFGSDSSHDSNF